MQKGPNSSRGFTGCPVKPHAQDPGSSRCDSSSQRKTWQRLQKQLQRRLTAGWEANATHTASRQKLIPSVCHHASLPLVDTSSWRVEPCSRMFFTICCWRERRYWKFTTSYRVVTTGHCVDVVSHHSRLFSLLLFNVNIFSYPLHLCN